MEADGGVCGGGKGILKEAGEIGVLDARGDVLDDLFDGVGVKGSAFGRGSLEGELELAFAKGTTGGRGWSASRELLCWVRRCEQFLLWPSHEVAC